MDCLLIAKEVMEWLDHAGAARIMVIGEPILDRYNYVEPLGKSPKDSIVTWHPTGRTDFRGGGWIVAEHARAISKNVCYQNEFDAPVLKERYVNKVFSHKVFALVDHAWMNESVMLPEGYDVCLVADYGHGLLREDAVARLAPYRFLALTVQSNSANWGFNLLTKWPRADYVVIDQLELRLACHDQHGDIEQLACQQARRMGTTMFAVTLGHEGCLVINGGAVVWSPAVADKVIDRMGAGDAFLAVTAPLVWAGAPADVVALVGNVAGGIKVGKLGNQPVTRAEIDARLKELLE